MEGTRENQAANQITLNVADIGASGEGIAKFKNNTIFIPFALPDEKVEIKIMHKKQNLMFGKLMEILTPSEERIRPKCKLFTKCGGCQLQHMKNYNQLKLKTKMVSSCFRKIAKIDAEISPAVKSENVFNYRNKLQLPVGFENNKTVVGFFEHNSHKIVPLEICHLHPEWQINLTKALKTFINKNHLRGYDYKHGTANGEVRHLVVREINRRLIITLVLNCEIDKNIVSDFVKSCANIYPNCSIYLNINKENSNIILGDTFIYVYGEKVLGGEALGIKFKCHPNVFFQVNDYIRDKIYTKVLSLILQEENTENVVIDAYSGIGILSAFIAKNVKKVYAIEIVKDAYEMANTVKELNGLSAKLENILGDCKVELENVLQRLKKERTSAKITVILDPPRKGCEKEALQAVLKYKPDRIVYISCNPSTLARDIGILCNTLNSDGSPKEADSKNKNKEKVKDSKLVNYLNKSDYEMTFVQPYDMFPQTKHVETVVCLQKV